ncbi:hypothetical protein EDD22DRAFT_847909 [Suillus occidentalis]|nr:hypothetical protein EDD22DRAFT_847909 [Suillus occidentalis]
MWERPTHLLYHILKTNLVLTYHEFKHVLDSIMKNMHTSCDLSLAYPLATNLWMGETPWRKFAKDLLTIYLHQSSDAVPLTWDTIDVANPFNTVEACLLLQGYIVQEVAADKDVQRVLDMAGWLVVNQSYLAYVAAREECFAVEANGIASDFQCSPQIINDFAALWTTAGNCPARVVGVVTLIALANPIMTFTILCVSVECSYDARDPKVTFGIPEEIKVVHPETQET